MSPLRRCTKVFKSESTGEIIETARVFDWRNVMEINDEAGAMYAYSEPRTLIITNYAEFFVVGRFEDVFAEMQEWETYEASAVVGVPFSKN